MVKKIMAVVLMIMILMSLFGCKKSAQQEINVQDGTIAVTRGEKIDGVILHGDTAKAMADIILVQTLQKDLCQYEKIDVVHDAVNRLWKVIYLPESGTVGGDTVIILSEKTGEVLSVTSGE